MKMERRGKEWGECQEVGETGEVGRLARWLLTTLPVQDQLRLELLVLIQGLADLLADELTGVWPIEEGAGTAPLHDLGPGETREVTEAIRAVDHREEPRHLGVAQHKVTVCKRTSLRGGTKRPRVHHPSFLKGLQPKVGCTISKNRVCVCWVEE